ncbi:MAG: RHS repeat-associated core domain-containing protein [Chloroflexi bacterium]|nr:RHS repeat-associated core domain-containing protein [Chloroflexota bacterium]
MGDASQEIIFYQSYDPYGNVLNTVTAGPESNYGFTGEWTDGNDLVHLRARYYTPKLGLLLTKDIWDGNALDPISFNSWKYGFANPIRYTDPSGWIPEDKALAAQTIRENLYQNFNVLVVQDWGFVHELKIENNEVYREALRANPQLSDCDWYEGAWSMLELRTVRDVVRDLASEMGSPDSFRKELGGIVLSQEDIRSVGQAKAHRIWFTNKSRSFGRWTVLHEFAHAWDANYGWRLSLGLEEFTGGHTDSLRGSGSPLSCQDNRDPGCNKTGYVYGGVPPKGADQNFTRKEDFAESVTAFLYPSEALAFINDPNHGLAGDPRFEWVDANGNVTSDFSLTPRGIFIGTLFNLAK